MGFSRVYGCIRISQSRNWAVPIFLPFDFAYSPTRLLPFVARSAVPSRDRLLSSSEFVAVVQSKALLKERPNYGPTDAILVERRASAATFIPA